MEIFIMSFLMSLIQIPGLILRYLPFSKLATQKQKKWLLNFYVLFFILENIIFFIIALNVGITPPIYRLALSLGGIAYFCINCAILKKMFFQHAFILGMQGCYCLVLHSFAAILLSQHAHHLTLHTQIQTQSILFLLLFILAAYPLWHFIKDSFYLNISIGYSYYWNLIWLIPILLWICSAITTMNNGWIDSFRQLSARIIMALIVFLLWKCINLDFKEIEEKFELKSTNKLLHIQMEGIRHQAEIMDENDENLRILRHDLRHHVQMLCSLIADNELAAASTILAQLNHNLENTKSIVFCKNPVINSCLLVYISKAQKEHIEIISEIDIPQDIPWNSNDIALLFANVLENAIHASREQPSDQKEIHIATRYADHKLAIIVKNRFNGEVLFNDKGMPVAMVEGHGIGMTSISAIVSKYHGDVACSHTNNLFTITFMFYESFAH